jgi:hypothetical protein
MKVGFTGTQQGMTPEQLDWISNKLGYLRAPDLSDEAHHGDCIGADAQFHSIAKDFGFLIILHPPLNPEKRAFCFSDNIRPEKDYLERNRAIVDETDILLAAPLESEEQLRSGTWATVRYARKQHKTVLVIFPNGIVQI